MRNEGLAIVRGQAGFSLIELVLVITLIGVLAGILIYPFREGTKGFVALETRGDLTSQAREAATRMVRELRNIQKEPDNTPNITSAGASSITFVDVLDNNITFALAGSTVTRSGDALVDKVSSLQFRYFNGSNGELSVPLNAGDLNNVRRILLTLTLSEGGQTVSVTEQVFLRELTGL